MGTGICCSKTDDNTRSMRREGLNKSKNISKYDSKSATNRGSDLYTQHSRLTAT